MSATTPKPCRTHGRASCVRVAQTITLPTAEDGEREIEVEVHAHVTPGAPARSPSYSSGGEPAEPAEAEIVDLLDADGKDWLPAVRAEDERREKELRAASAKVRALARVESQEERLEAEVLSLAELEDDGPEYDPRDDR